MFLYIYMLSDSAVDLRGQVCHCVQLWTYYGRLLWPATEAMHRHRRPFFLPWPEQLQGCDFHKTL